MNFTSTFVYGIGSYYRTITVNCTHYATKNGVTYETTSSAQIAIPEQLRSPVPPRGRK